jgi:cob(I)alamin adenosyltransferase
MPIYTRFGDKGKTSLIGGEIVPKSDLRVEAYGSVDELNAALGLVLAFSEMEAVTSTLAGVQDDLFVIGSELASKGRKTRTITPVRMSRLEAEIDRMSSELPPLNHFILPGGSKAASLLHFARTVCRRTERKAIALSERDKINPDTIVYLNRLGDLLFVLARYVNYRKKVPETVWRGK